MNFAPGQYVLITPHLHTEPVRITGVDRWRITWETTDGVTNFVEETCYRTLEEETRNWVLATPEQMAVFQSRYKPAPINYE